MKIFKYFLTIVLVVSCASFYILIQSAINYWGEPMVYISLLDKSIDIESFPKFIAINAIVSMILIGIIVAIEQTEDNKRLERSRKQYKQLN